MATLHGTVIDSYLKLCINTYILCHILYYNVSDLKHQYSDYKYQIIFDKIYILLLLYYTDCIIRSLMYDFAVDSQENQLY